jgi:hypothetical protein
MEESPGSKAGKKYLSATCQEIPNLGQKALVGKTREGQPRGIIFQVAPVRKPLMSMAKMNEAGNDVNLRGDQPHIQNTKTKQITALRREGKTSSWTCGSSTPWRPRRVQTLGPRQ